MTGEELYNMMLQIGTRQHGPQFAAFYPTWEEAGDAAHDIYNETSKILGSQAPKLDDEQLGQMSWADQHQLYQKLYMMGHRIY